MAVQFARLDERTAAIQSDQVALRQDMARLANDTRNEVGKLRDMLWKLVAAATLGIPLLQTIFQAIAHAAGAPSGP